MDENRSQHGFSLVELLVVISILVVLSGVLVPRVSTHMRHARDERRIADVQHIRRAIEQFQLDRGEFPRPNPNSSYGSWDVSHDGNFIRELRKHGYLDEEAGDPVNNTRFHYRYFVYEEGEYGCEGEGPFYVLGITEFEDPGFAAKHRGFFRCAGRNWSNEFAYVTGGGGVSRP